MIHCVSVQRVKLDLENNMHAHCDVFPISSTHNNAGLGVTNRRGLATTSTYMRPKRTVEDIQ